MARLRGGRLRCAVDLGVPGRQDVEPEARSRVDDLTVGAVVEARETGWGDDSEGAEVMRRNWPEPLRHVGRAELRLQHVERIPQARPDQLPGVLAALRPEVVDVVARQPPLTNVSLERELQRR